MARTGRPKLDEPMSYRVTVRFNEKSYQRLKAYSESIGISMTDVMKQGLELLYKEHKKK